MTIFGADYWHPAVPQAREADLANTEWWLGFLSGDARELSQEAEAFVTQANNKLASDTTLMRAREPGRPLYGYRHDPRAAIDKAKAKPLSTESTEDERQQHLDKEQWGGCSGDARELSQEAEAFVTQANNKRLPPIKRLLRLLSCGNDRR